MREGRGLGLGVDWGVRVRRYLLLNDVGDAFSPAWGFFRGGMSELAEWCFGILIFLGNVRVGRVTISKSLALNIPRLSLVINIVFVRIVCSMCFHVHFGTLFLLPCFPLAAVDGGIVAATREGDSRGERCACCSYRLAGVEVWPRTSFPFISPPSQAFAMSLISSIYEILATERVSSRDVIRSCS